MERLRGCEYANIGQMDEHWYVHSNGLEAIFMGHDGMTIAFCTGVNYAELIPRVYEY